MGGCGRPQPASSADLFKVVDDLGSSFSQVKMLFLLEDGGEHSVKEIATHLGLSPRRLPGGRGAHPA